nr:MORN repeat-containing protein [Marseillevirus cajuinensis]
MASLKVSCACLVLSKTDVEELDELLEEIKNFASSGKDGYIQGTFYIHSSFVQRYLGWKPFKNGGSEFYLNREGKICGLLKGNEYKGVFGSETMYFDGKKHGLEILRKYWSDERVEIQWKNGRCVEFSFRNKVSRVEHYKENLLDGTIEV